MVEFPNAKINLGLNIIEKREDGFHNLSSCFFPINWCDILEITESQKFEFNMSGYRIPGIPEQNLCVIAYKLLKKDYQLPNVSIHLHKTLPFGAGLGGGSSNASFTLKLLNELFQLFLDDNILELYAEQIGSDCPFFIRNIPVIAEGKGEIMNPINLDISNYYIVVLYPGIENDTATAYKHVIPAKFEQSISYILQNKDLKEWKSLLINDFEKSVFARFPEIESLKNTLYDAGALYASMSGSGSAVYGIFDHPVDPQLFNENVLVWSGSLN